LKSVTLYKSISEFIVANDLKAAVRDAEIEMEWQTYFKSFLPIAKSILPEIKDHLGNDIDSILYYRKIEHQQLPSDNNDGTITIVYEPENIKLDLEWIEEIGVVSIIFRTFDSVAHRLSCDFFFFKFR